MKAESSKVIKTYLSLMLLSTFASSFIWGVNTLFLLDAGLTITEAFAANAFFTVGQVIFEVPTGVVADTAGRRTSYLLGCATLLVATLVYLLMWQIGAPFWAWALTSIGLGLGFTFFSGATEAWLVDALAFTKHKGSLESVFGKGQVASGVAMLIGTIAGGVIAQATNLGVPYILRCVSLGLTFLVALFLMKDLGFKPRKSERVSTEVRSILRASMKYGVNNAPVRWIMIAGIFSVGTTYYVFYALQPYLLELYGNSASYAIAGLGAAIAASAQIFGGMAVPYFRKAFRSRTGFLITTLAASAAALITLGLTSSFFIAILLVIVWAVVFATTFPVRQAYINGLIPSQQRATVLSSDSLISSAGAAVSQPGLGKVADVWGYGTSYIVTGAFTLLAMPFLLLARKERASSDPIRANEAKSK